MHTVWDHLMLVAMTGRTAYLGMLAFMLLKLSHLVCMTGQTWLSEVVVNGDCQRCMGVVMAGGTVVEFVMLRSLMALATLRDDVFS